MKRGVWIVAALLAAGCGSSSNNNNNNDVNVTGTKIVTVVSANGGTTQQPVDLTASTIEALVPQADGGFTVFAGSGTDAGTFTIPNVPTGKYVLHVGNRYFAGDARTWDLGINSTRQDTVLADAGTTLDLTLTNLAPWGVGDDIQLYSENASLYFDFANDFSSTQPTTGDTSYSGSIDYAGGNPGNDVLLDATKGDQFSILQLQYQTETSSVPDAGGPFGYFGLVSTGTTSVTMKDAQANPASDTLSPVAQSNVSVDFDFPAFDAVVPANATAYGVSYSLDAIPRTDLGFYVATPDEITYWVQPGQPRQTVTFKDGEYHAGWKKFTGTLDYYTFPTHLTSADGGTATGHVFGENGIHAFEQLTTVAPVLGAPQSPKLNGQDATGDLKGVGLTPNLTWTAPSRGTAKYYRVDVYRLQLASTKVAKAYVTSVTTFDTQVQIPPGVLENGQSYIFVIEARDDAKVTASHPTATDVGDWADGATGSITP